MYFKFSTTGSCPNHSSVGGRPRSPHSLSFVRWSRPYKVTTTTKGQKSTFLRRAVFIVNFLFYFFIFCFFHPGWKNTGPRQTQRPVLVMLYITEHLAWVTGRWLVACRAPSVTIGSISCPPRRFIHPIGPFHPAVNCPNFPFLFPSFRGLRKN